MMLLGICERILFSLENYTGKVKFLKELILGKGVGTSASVPEQ